MATEIPASRDFGKPIIAKTAVDGFVDGPADEVDPEATYTFEARVEGRWYRWTGQRPEIVGDRARFYLRDGTPIDEPVWRREQDSNLRNTMV